MTETRQAHEARAARRVRLAVAQTVLRHDPRDGEALRETGRELRGLMHAAHEAGARIVHFPEGALCSPDKHVLAEGQDGASRWEAAEWAVLQQELAAIASLAGELGLWTLVGAPHRLTGPNRPHNSLYVIDDRGRIATRYDERLLSRTKVTRMYAPGREPATFVVDGMRFGCLLGIEVHYPELVAAYERADVDCVLFSTAGGMTAAETAVFATEAQAHASIHSLWMSFAVDAAHSAAAPAGIVSPAGRWLARCQAAQAPAQASGLAVADLDDAADDVEIAVHRARPWRRTARSGLYTSHFVLDPRSEDRTLI
jgi:predicted amidohydrolase